MFSLVRVVIGGTDIFYRSFAMSSTVLPLQSRVNHWTDGLMLNKHGVPLGNLRNVLYALRNAPEWHDVLGYDAFAARAITRKPPSWSDRTAEQWTDYDDTRACEWFQENQIAAPVGVVGRGIQTVARENLVHPVRDYLNALSWDETTRLDTWLTTYLGVEEQPAQNRVAAILVSTGFKRYRPGKVGQPRTPRYHREAPGRSREGQARAKSG